MSETENLDQRILSSLAQQDARSMSDLGARLGIARSVVRERVRTLEDEDLLERTSRRVKLTAKGRVAAGQEDVAQAQTRLTDEILAAAMQQVWETSGLRAADFQRLLPPAEMLKHIGIGQAESMRRHMEAAKNAAALLPTLKGVHAQLAQRLVSGPFADPRFAERMTASMKAASSLLKAQGMMSDPQVQQALVTALGQPKHFPFSSQAVEAAAHAQLLHNVWSKNQLPRGAPAILSTIVRDSGKFAERIRQDMEFVGSSPLLRFRPISGMARNIASVARAYDHQTAYSFSELAKILDSPAPGDSVRSTTEARQGLSLPSYTAHALVSSARTSLELEGSRKTEALTVNEPKAPEVEEVLKTLGPRFERRWKGAWHAVQTQSPDAATQVGASLRELLNEVLEELVPYDSLAESEKGLIERKEASPRRVRVFHIYGYGGKDAANFQLAVADAAINQATHVEAVAKAVVKGYQHLSNDLVHDNKDVVVVGLMQLAGALYAMGGVILSLVSRVIEPNSHLQEEN